MENSPFNRSAKTPRSPPPTPRPPSPEEEAPEVVSTPEIQNWMTSIEQHLNEICQVSSEGKLNSDQKLKINSLCRKVANGTSQMAVLYQSLKQKALLNYNCFQALKEKQSLAEQLLELKQTIKDTKNTPAGPLSYTDVVKTRTNNFIRPSTVSSVAIYPNDKLKSSEETKSLVQKLVNPEKIKLHVRGLRKVKNGGLIISTDSKEDIEKLKHSVQQTSSDLTFDEPHKRKPRVIIVGVPVSMNEQEVYNCIFEQNLTDKMKDLSRDQFLTAIKLSHKSGKKEAEICNYIIEVPPTIRKALIAQNRVFINWSSCPVRDFTIVTRCFKCQQYGHAAKTCKNSVYTCGHCGEIGHSTKECTKQEQSPKCATCLVYKKPSNHKTGDVECPARKMAEQRYINSIDYGGA